MATTVTGVAAVDGNPADPNTGNAPSSSPYKAYVALISQSGTGVPTATVLNSSDANYLGEVIFIRTQIGVYRLQKEGAFTLGKTYINCQINWSDCTANYVVSATSDISSDFVFLYSFLDTAITATDIDGNGVFIEIRVYQN